MAKKDNGSIVPADISTGIMSMDEEAMDILGPDGVGIDLLPRIELKHAGTVAFGLQSVEADDEELVKGSEGFDAVILFMHQVRAYWEKGFDERDESDPFPDCSSLDARVGTRRETNEEVKCAGCEFAQWGSGTGQGQACSARMRMFLLMKDSTLPRFILVPTTSIKAVKFYWVQLRDKGRNYNNVVTHFGAEKAIRADGGIEYSKLTLTKVGDIPDEDAERLEPMRDMCKQGSKRTAVSAAQEDKSSKGVSEEVKKSNAADEGDDPFGDE